MFGSRFCVFANPQVETKLDPKYIPTYFVSYNSTSKTYWFRILPLMFLRDLTLLLMNNHNILWLFPHHRIPWLFLSIPSLQFRLGSCGRQTHLHYRLLLCGRPEEHGVSLDYLRDLHEKHEKWLLPAQTGSGGILSVSPALRAPMSPRIRDRVFYLEGDHVHSCIQKVCLLSYCKFRAMKLIFNFRSDFFKSKYLNTPLSLNSAFSCLQVPALMLDCDQNIDFSKDLEAKAE